MPLICASGRPIDRIVANGQQRAKQQAEAQRSDRDDVGYQVGSLGQIVFGLGFLDLKGDQLVEVDLGGGEQPGCRAGHVRVQLVEFALGQQGEAGLQALLDIFLSLGSERVGHQLLFGRQIGRHIFGPGLADRLGVSRNRAGDVSDGLARSSVRDGAIQHQRIFLHSVVDVEELRKRHRAILIDRFCPLIDLVHGEQADGADDQGCRGERADQGDEAGREGPGERGENVGRRPLADHAGFDPVGLRLPGAEQFIDALRLFALVGWKPGSDRHVAGDLTAFEDRRGACQHPVEVAVLAAVLHRSGPRLAGLQRVPEVFERLWPAYRGGE